jgi:tetratricopeptide (TPR) repeat protein
MTDIDTAKKLAPNNYWVAVDRGIILLSLNKRPEALEEFRQAIALEPNNFFAYIYSAGIKDDLNDYEGAEQDYTILAKLRPDYYFAFEGLGMYKMKKGLWAEARDAFQRAYKQAPEETSYALLAAINWMRATGRPGDAKDFLAQALRKIPRETLEWYLFRLFHDMAGDNDVAMRVDKEKNPEQKARMLFYLAHYYDIRGNKILAEKYFLQVNDLGRQGIPEWKLNRWILESRNLVEF